MKKISVAIVSAYVGKTPKDIDYSFVFDEAYRLALRDEEAKTNFFRKSVCFKCG